MDRIGLKAGRSVSVTEIMTVHKHRFRKESFTRKGDIHNFPEIIYCTDGDLYVTVDNNEYIIKAGEMFIYAPNSYHVLTRPASTGVLIVSFVPGYEKIKKIYNKAIQLDKEAKEYFINTVEEMVDSVTFSVNDGIPELKLKNGVPKIQEEILKYKLELFLLMLEKSLPDMFGSGEKISPELSSVISNLENNISANYTIYEMAKQNMMSESKLKKLFREHLHTSPVSYFHKMKIDYAKDLLLEGDKNITEVSEKLGFQSIHYFSRFFKTHVGVCPTDYIKAINIHPLP